MSQTAFRGVFTIPCTPFDETGEIDWPGFRRVIDFCVACGAHGVVWPVNASAFAVLTDEELDALAAPTTAPTAATNTTTSPSRPTRSPTPLRTPSMS